jgi:hypothetical protein
MRHLLAVVTAGLMCTSIASATPDFWDTEWPNTDFSKTSVEWSEILSGGPPKDGIPALMDPVMVSVGDDVLIEPNEPVMTVELDGETARAYPIRYLTWHEIVNDEVGNVPFTVTFCPLCNSGLVFDRRLNGQTLDFGVSGKLRNSDMVMYDRQTESWWQQFVGEAIVGDLLGQKLTKIPAWMESWDDFKTRNPDGVVMAEPKGYSRPYGSNPYVNYDGSSQPFLYRGENPPHDVHPLARVVVIGDNAWPLTRFQETSTITEDGLTLTWKAGTASALDQRKISASRDVGAIRVKDANGLDVAHDVAFAFAFHAFFPEGNWKLGK